MRLIKFIIIPLYLLIIGCKAPDVDIDIGNYNYNLEAWNNQNMLDYQLTLVYSYDGGSERAVVIVKNGIPESSDPPTWLSNDMKSTIPDFFSFIIYISERKDRVRDGRFYNTTNGFFKVRYDFKYYYPSLISYAYRTTHSDRSSDWFWEIKLEPLEE